MRCFICKKEIKKDEQCIGYGKSMHKKCRDKLKENWWEY